jgi:hypothetical protein
VQSNTNSGLGRAAIGLPDSSVSGTPNVDFGELIAHLAADRKTRGTQLYVSIHGQEVCNTATGLGRPGLVMRTSTSHNLYCGLKPVAALVLASHLEVSGLDETAYVGELLDLNIPGPQVSDLLCHNVGLQMPDAFRFWRLSATERDSELSPLDLVARCATGVEAYSEVAASALTVALLCKLARTRPETVLANSLRNYRLAGMFFSLSSYDAADRANIGCYFDNTFRLPLLHDLVQAFWSPPIPAVNSGYASMEALGRWYSLVFACYRGADVVGLPSTDMLRRWVLPKRQVAYDATLKRSCSFGLGVMTNLSRHGFGNSVGPRAFGHSGFLGNSFGFVDPDEGLVVAALSNTFASGGPGPFGGLPMGEFIDRLYCYL